MEHFILKAIKEAWEASTMSRNAFASAILSISWDRAFEADGEMYFVKGDLCLTTPSLDPFDCAWRPNALFADGSSVDI